MCQVRAASSAAVDGRISSTTLGTFQDTQSTCEKEREQSCVKWRAVLHLEMSCSPTASLRGGLEEDGPLSQAMPLATEALRA